MKKLFLFFILTIGLSVSSPSVAATENPERGLTVEMGFSLSRVPGYEYDGNPAPIKDEHIISPMFIPRLGYRFNPQWAVGLMYVNNTAKEDRPYRYNSFGAYIERSFFRFASGRMSFFTDLQYLYTRTRWENEFTECGLVPGLAFHIPGAPVDVKLRYLFVGFNDSPAYMKKELGGCLGRGKLILDAGLHRLQIGASVTF